MTWGFVALAGAAVGGAAIASSSASSARKSAARSEATQVAFAQEQYDDWQEVYGPIQTNLSTYYSSLSPEYYEVQGLEAFEKEQTRANTQLDETLAQRGITDSGIAAQIETEQALSSAETRAQIRTQAPAVAAEEKLRFLQVGLGQSPGAALSQTLAQRTASASERSLQSDIAAGQAAGSAVTAVGTALAGYTATPTPNLQ